MDKLRNYRELTQKEIDRLKELYSTTTNRELSKIFSISIDAIQDHFAYPNGWKKAGYRQGSRGGRPLDDKSVAWIVRHFKHTRNQDILEKFGIGENTLHRIARKHGLKKSRQYMGKVAQANSQQAMDVCHRYKVYEQNAEFARMQWRQWRAEGREIGFRKGESNKDRLSPKRFREMYEKNGAARRETIRRERMRINWGLPQKTRLKVYGAGRKASAYRHLLKKRNYIVERGSTTIYYDELTQRSPVMENRAAINGLIIKEAI